MEFIDLTDLEEQPILKFETRTVASQETETFTIAQTKLPETESEDEEESAKSVLKFTPGEVTELNVTTFELEETELSDEEEEQVCVRECSLGANIKCPDNTGYFSIDNLFGELRTEYEKLVARTNLGIGTDMSLKWGNILGNLANLTDLVKFINEQVTTSKNNLYSTIMEKIDLLNTESKSTTLYYGPSTDNLTKSTSITFTTGSYDGYIYVLTPNENTTFIVNGICGGFEYISTKQLDDLVFYLFKSAYEKLGVTTITVSYG